MIMVASYPTTTITLCLKYSKTSRELYLTIVNAVKSGGGGGDPILDLSGMLVTFGGLKFRILVTLRVSERSW